MLRLIIQFLGDVGVFCTFLLNYLTLHPGGETFLGAREPRACKLGVVGSIIPVSVRLLFNRETRNTLEIVECTANPDSVVRAGLKPKLRDVPDLVSTLTFTS